MHCTWIGDKVRVMASRDSQSGNSASHDGRGDQGDQVVPGEPGSVIIGANVAFTAVFLVSAVVSTVLFSNPWKVIAVVVSLACFSLGVVAFLWGYWNAVQRSREENIGVASLYFLTDGVAPGRVARVMNVCLAVQVTCGLVTALARKSTDGRPGSTLAFGILVPMLGLGLNGLWGAFHGTFGPRLAAPTRHNGEMPSGGSENGQDTDHD